MTDFFVFVVLMAAGRMRAKIPTFGVFGGDMGENQKIKFQKDYASFQIIRVVIFP